MLLVSCDSQLNAFLIRTIILRMECPEKGRELGEGSGEPGAAGGAQPEEKEAWRDLLALCSSLRGGW